MHKPKGYLYGTANIASGNQAEVVINTFSEAVNVHGLRIELGLGTPTASTTIGVNWALLCMPEGLASSAQGIISDTNINARQLQNYIWLVGKTLVDRQEYVNMTIAPKSSRSCPGGSFMSFVVRYENAIRGTTPSLDASVGIQWWETQI